MVQRQNTCFAQQSLKESLIETARDASKQEPLWKEPRRKLWS